MGEDMRRNAWIVVLVVAAASCAGCIPAVTRLGIPELRHVMPVKTRPTPTTIAHSAGGGGGGGAPAPAVTTTTVPRTTTTTAPPSTSTTLEDVGAAPRLFAYGHSYVSGVPGGATPWPVPVAATLHRTLVNRGHGGDILEQTLAVIQADRPLPSAGDIAIIEVGLNDARLYGTDSDRVPLFEQRLRDAIALLSSDGADVYLAVDAPIVRWDVGGVYANGSDAALAMFDDAARSVTPNIVDMGAHWDRSTMIGGDDIHPNTTGETALKQAVLDVIR